MKSDSKLNIFIEGNTFENNMCKHFAHFVQRQLTEINDRDAIPWFVVLTGLDMYTQMLIPQVAIPYGTYRGPCVLARGH